MSELDPFELRFAEAYRRYVAKAPQPPYPASVVRAIAAEPVRRSIEWPWVGPLPALRLGQALAWLVILGLLIAAFAAAIFVGSQRPAVAFACPRGSTPDTPGPVGQARPADFGGMAFDRQAGRLVTLSGTDTWTFDVCTNTWQQMHPAVEPPTPGVGPLVYDAAADVVIGLFGPDENPSEIWAYDLKADAWRELGSSAPFADPRLSSLAFYDPVQDLVVARGDDGDASTLGLALWGYEVKTKTWTALSPAEPIVIGPHYEFFAYDPASARLVVYARSWGSVEADSNRAFGTWTWLFDLRTGLWSEADAVTPPYFNAGLWGLSPGIAYDEAAQKTVMMGQGYSAVYDARADHWETLFATTSEEAGGCGIRPECRELPEMVYDSVNERLVVYGGSVYVSADQGWVSPGDILAYETRTGDWTVLLEAP